MRKVTSNTGQCITNNALKTRKLKKKTIKDNVRNSTRWLWILRGLQLYYIKRVFIPIRWYRRNIMQ